MGPGLNATGDHAPALINTAIARSRLKCVERPARLGHNPGHKQLRLDPESRKRLILNGEMSEWLKEHAWKAMRCSDEEVYRSTFSAAASTT